MDPSGDFKFLNRLTSYKTTTYVPVATCQKQKRTPVFNTSILQPHCRVFFQEHCRSASLTAQAKTILGISTQTICRGHKYLLIAMDCKFLFISPDPSIKCTSHSRFKQPNLIFFLDHTNYSFCKEIQK